MSMHLDHAYNSADAALRERYAAGLDNCVDLSEPPRGDWLDAIRAADDAELMVIARLAHLGCLYAAMRSLEARDDHG